MSEASDTTTTRRLDDHWLPQPLSVASVARELRGQPVVLGHARILIAEDGVRVNKQ